MVNGTAGLKLVPFSPLFTGWERVRVTQLADVPGKAAAFAPAARSMDGSASLVVTLQPSGGYVALLEKE